MFKNLCYLNRTRLLIQASNRFISLRSSLLSSQSQPEESAESNSKNESNPTSIGGHDYFKQLTRNKNIESTTTQYDDKNIKSKHFAKTFINRQIEYHKKFNNNKKSESIKDKQSLDESHSINKSDLKPKMRSNKYNDKDYQRNEYIKKFKPNKIEKDETSLTVDNQIDNLQEPFEYMSVKNEDLNDKIDNLTEEEKLELEIKELVPATRQVVYNLAYFVNKSDVLKKFVEMGVHIRKWDEDTSIGSFILKLDMNRDIKPHLIFLHDIGIPAENHAFIIEKNPHFFKDSIEDLNARIDYLKSKKFSQEAIKTILTKTPKWLSLSVSDLDTKLGWFQREFNLTGPELREIVTERPKLVTLPLRIASNIKFGLKEILTYDDESMKSLIKKYPKLFTKDFDLIETNFIFLTKVVKLTHEEIASHPFILVAPLINIKSRYAYLKSLNRLQFDPTKPNYVSLKSFTEPDDKIFCSKTAKTSLDDYKKFLKTV